MLLHRGYSEEKLNTIRKRLEEVKNKSMPITRLTKSQDDVCGLDMVDIAYRLVSKEAQHIFAHHAWFDANTFDPDTITVGQILSAWDELLTVPYSD